MSIKFNKQDDLRFIIPYNETMRNIRVQIPGLLLLLMLALLAASCNPSTGPVDNPVEDESLKLMTRLEMADFSLVTSDAEAVAVSLSVLSNDLQLPDPWSLEFSGGELSLPELDPGNAYGISHPNGRASVIYTFPASAVPTYEQIVPVAVAHYRIGEAGTDLILLLVAFQSDPGGSNTGVGVLSLNTDGLEMSAPFALALTHDELSGRFFYDDFLSGDSDTALAGRPEWDQGVLILTRLGEEVVLSTYLPWY